MQAEDRRLEEEDHFQALQVRMARMMGLWNATDAILSELEFDRELYELIHEETGERAECPSCDRVMALLRTTVNLHKTIEMPVTVVDKAPRRYCSRARNVLLAAVATVSLSMGGSLGLAMSVAAKGPTSTQNVPHHSRRRSAPSTQRVLVGAFT